MKGFVDGRDERIYISEELEQALVSALLRGHISLDDIPVTSLSKNGQAVCAGVEFLVEKKAQAPYASALIVSTACDVAGGDSSELRPYVDFALKQQVAGEPGAVVKHLYQQRALSEIMSEASRQLATKEFDPGAFSEKLSGKYEDDDELIPACDMLVNDELPPEPTGYPIPSLPRLTEASGGLMGVWAVGGKAKMGKSTLGVQIALDMPIPVLYYDLENGNHVTINRMGHVCGSKEAYKERTKRFYIKNKITRKKLDAALKTKKMKPPALIVIDSIQKLPTKADQRRTGIDEWLRKFEQLKADGYSVLLISEVNGTGQYKETGEIEYTVDFGMQLQRDGGSIVATVVANRHREMNGDLCYLERVNKWKWKESLDLASVPEDESEDL